MGRQATIETNCPKGLKRELDALIHSGTKTQEQLAVWLTENGFAVTKRIINRYCNKLNTFTNELTSAGMPYEMAITYRKELEQLSKALLIHECNKQAIKDSGQAIIDIKKKIPFFNQEQQS